MFMLHQFLLFLPRSCQQFPCRSQFGSHTRGKSIVENALAGWLGWEDSNSLTNRSDDDRLKRSGGHATD